jgi:ABC-type multidrug transport system ATPase subunit
LADLTLIVTRGDAVGSEMRVDGELLIGRAVNGPGGLGGDPKLSRQHARIVTENGGLVVEDLGSTNGTVVNGTPVVGRHPLREGDEIGLGRTTLQVRAVTANGGHAGPALAKGGALTDAPGKFAPHPRTEPLTPAESGRPAEPPVAARMAPPQDVAMPIEQIGSPSALGYIPTAGPPRGQSPAAPEAHVLYAGQRIEVPPAGLTIGREQGNDLIVASEQASRRHASILAAEGRHFVADLGTVNGTELNGERLRGESRFLNAGDTIVVAGEVLRFVSGAETTFGAAPAAPRAAQAVSFNGTRLAIGRHDSNDLALSDPNVSRFHAEVVSTPAGIELRDLGSRNGTRLNGQPVSRAALTTGSEIGIGPFRLVFDGTSFLRRDDRGALRMDAEAVTMTVRGKTILNAASISLQPGELTVIIGESGSGKSTMIKALAGVTRPTSGTVSVNGEPVAARLTDLGYVPQDEIVHRYLTVDEALRYSAKLRLPPDSSRADIDAAVGRVLEELSLTEHANTLIGSLSGGQRKRAGLAVELLNRPSLLFLDEPTTGLDPGLETRMMELFRALAADGTRAVTVVTHATKNLALADKICVMGRGGELTFFGTPEEAKGFFRADTFDGIYQALEDRPATDWRREYETRHARPAHDTAAPAPVRRAAAGRVGRNPAPRQAGILARRYARLMMRDTRNMMILLGQVPVIALGIALLFTGDVFKNPGPRPADGATLLFLLSTTAIWLGSIDGSREIIKERSVADRESAIGVRTSAYLFSKTVVLFTLSMVQTLLLAGIVLALRPLHEPIGTYALLLGVLTVTSFVAVGMGLLISAAVSSEDQATSFIPLALIPQLLFAGAIVTVARMSDAMSYISNVVFARWSFADAGSAIHMHGRLAANPQQAQATGYGSDFFSVHAPVGFLILAGFLAVFLGATAWKMSQRRA